MNNSWQKILLDKLLDKYERSVFFRQGRIPDRRIMFKLYDGGRSDFSQYEVEDADKLAAINRAVLELAAARIVEFKWMRGDVNHLIAEVWLNFDNLAAAYTYVSRQPKILTVDKVCQDILSALEKVRSEWIKKYLEDIYTVISSKRDLGNKLPADFAERTDLLRALTFIDRIGTAEILERVFSLQCFGDSKRFEQKIKTRLLSILRKYLDADDDVQDEELLRQIGIVKYPEQFEFCGNVSLGFGCGKVDFTPLLFGSCICREDLQRAVLTIAPEIKKILSIENRANYIHYVQTNKTAQELVIYHGGQYSPSKKIFFQRLVEAMPEQCLWYHWGDIDYGGFSMLARLRREIKQDILAYRMNGAELLKYVEFTAAMTKSYAEKLANLISKPELEDCRECLEKMLQENKKLEQEAMLIHTK